ncbi:hypothetical protein GCM10023195_52350 [Actinoallomurus liliacearum]|uniref:Uncharacterized protein n=1 Tax=Actinoallomurus liliacearum TaxID=1080073 RepID=A0ABP8TRQ2_9ACTN
MGTLPGCPAQILFPQRAVVRSAVAGARLEAGFVHVAQALFAAGTQPPAPRSRALCSFVPPTAPRLTCAPLPAAPERLEQRDDPTTIRPECRRFGKLPSTPHRAKDSENETTPEAEGEALVTSVVEHVLPPDEGAASR